MERPLRQNGKFLKGMVRLKNMLLYLFILCDTKLAETKETHRITLSHERLGILANLPTNLHIYGGSSKKHSGYSKTPKYVLVNWVGIKPMVSRHSTSSLSTNLVIHKPQNSESKIHDRFSAMKGKHEIEGI
jgi:hypothetical protein